MRRAARLGPAVRVVVALVSMASGPALAGEAWRGPPSFEARFLGRRPARPPARIVSVAPNVTELIFALGAGGRVVGVTRYDDYPPEVTALTRVGGFLDPNPEVILGLAPDLIIAAPNASNRGVLDRLAALGTPVLVVPGNSFADLFYALDAIGDALGGGAAAKARDLERRLSVEVEAIRALIRGRTTPRVAVVYDRQPLVLAGPGSFADTLLGMVGAQNVVKVEVEYPSYSREQLLLDAPEVIIDASSVHWALKTGTSTSSLRALPLDGRDADSAFWAQAASVPARRPPRVFVVQGTALLRPGPRLISALRELALAVH